jgi:hypothetical protein
VNGQGFNVGIGFAVPVDTINKIVPSLIRKGSYVPPALGIRSASDQIARALRVDGVVVESVQPGSGAESAGVRPMEASRSGDIQAEMLQVDKARHRTPSTNPLAPPGPRRVPVVVIRAAEPAARASSCSKTGPDGFFATARFSGSRRVPEREEHAGGSRRSPTRP